MLINIEYYAFEQYSDNYLLCFWEMPIIPNIMPLILAKNVSFTAVLDH